MDLTALVFSSGWASGVNAYATVAMLGLLERFSNTPVVPEALGRTDVLAIASTMFLVEFVVDKVPWLDSVWDGISTFIRPTVGALVAWQLSGDASSVDQAFLIALGGGTALASHGVKSGIRLAVNTSPEPFTNSIVSTGEDISVIAVVALAVAHPWASLGVSASLLLVGMVAVALLWRTISRARRRRSTATP